MIGDQLRALSMSDETFRVARAVVGRHRAVSRRGRWRLWSAPAVAPVQRLPGVEVVYTETKLAHQVSPDELVAGHQRGEFVAVCGARFLPASLVESGRGRCRECAQ
jgi:hypothetical protein